ncbi:MAG TPA: glycosyltransferase [Gallicola sp.]|jgi:glycosyltransferase involved in cell wall biosynthesis|nr:glycosyltransferase [Gallicola sp.]
MDKTQEPLVSICCITYNHEKYIRDAIEGFLMQETEFPFEIIIHDDASTDMTAAIIREYEKKYPELIKPIYQTENQYSKRRNAPLSASFKKAKGKYIALCEGDDYWTDPLKLQKQITEMEKNPECYISFHPATVKWDDESRADQVLSLHSEKNKIFTIEEVILGSGEFIPTNSIVINKLAISRITSFFDLAKEAPIGDYYIQILGAENGGALYLSDIMSVYRRGVSGSWSERFQKSCKDNNSGMNSLIAANNKMDAFTNHKYSKQFTIENKRFVLMRLKSTDIDVRIRKSFLENHNEYISFKEKILWYTILKNPKIIKILKGIRNLFFRSTIS